MDAATLFVAILAAGKSTRMGGRPKLCLPWASSNFQRETLGEESPATILSHLITEWRRLGAARILVVLGQGNHDPVLAELDSLAARAKSQGRHEELFHGVNATATLYPERDMMGSVQTAAAHIAREMAEGAFAKSVRATHLVIALGDQPHLQSLTLHRMVDATRDPAHAHAILRPRRNGRGGHPMAIPRHLVPELAATELPTLKHFLQLHVADMVDIPCEDPGLVLDIDTPEDYEQARNLVSATNS
ncbi:MAG: NTP transferase domain-containing protein [Candidatus Methylacidiphilales bacterium]